MNKISVILATFNEEKNIKDCLESVKDLADEIVIVDGTSTDRTVEIAGKYTSKIIVKDNPLMFHKNKQLAIDKATGDWILYLDADERVTPELAREIKRVVAREPKRAGFWIPRKNIIFGKWIKSDFWWPDYQLRLFKRGKGFLPCKSVHEQPKVSGKTKYLKGPLIHYNYQTVSQYVDRLNCLYTENDKNAFLNERKKITWLDAIRFPCHEFFATFFARKAYKDGLHGLVLSLLQAFSSLVTFAKIWEAQGFKEDKEKNFLAKTESEFRGMVKEGHYWFLTSKVETARNLLVRMFLRAKRKFLS